jgi:aminopeptidase N
MYQTLLGVDGFNKGMQLYFERHDGSAVTCDDFLSAMADANGKDLSQFSRWYSTPGTPTVKYSHSYKDGTFALTLSQENKGDGPLHIPVTVGLLDKKSGDAVVPTTLLELKEMKQTFTFDGLKGEVIPSILRDFSAPVKLMPESGEVDEESLAFLAARDTDSFNKWEAGQVLYTSLILQTMNGNQSEKTLQYCMEAFGRTLSDKDNSDYSMQAYTLILPTESTLAEEMETKFDPVELYEARGAVKKAIARKFKKELKEHYDELTQAVERETVFKVDAESIGRRRLRNVFLEYLCSIRETDEDQEVAAELALNHFVKAKGMTDKMAGLSALASMDGKGATARDKAMQQFYDDAEGDALVLNKWFSAQALADRPDILNQVKQLMTHPEFTFKNPNRFRSLIGSFTMNTAAFHAKDGTGYRLLGDILVELDELNPQISSRMAGSLIKWRKYDETRGALMKAELEKLASKKLSDDLFEIVNRGLK